MTIKMTEKNKFGPPQMNGNKRNYSGVHYRVRGGTIDIKALKIK